MKRYSYRACDYSEGIRLKIDDDEDGEWVKYNEVQREIELTKESGRQCVKMMEDVKDVEIKRLTREKEWLLDNWASARGCIWPTAQAQKETIIREMQQALKGEIKWGG